MTSCAGEPHLINHIPNRATSDTAAAPVAVDATYAGPLEIRYRRGTCKLAAPARTAHTTLEHPSGRSRQPLHSHYIPSHMYSQRALALRRVASAGPDRPHNRRAIPPSSFIRDLRQTSLTTLRRAQRFANTNPVARAPPSVLLSAQAGGEAP